MSPWELTLSGGLDSTAVLTEAAKHAPRLVAFTSVYRGDQLGRSVDEEKWARLAVRPYTNVELRPVDAAIDEWIGTLRKIAWHMDGPGYSPAVFPLWRIMESARAAKIPVLLEGQGADELLGGYVQYAAVDAIQTLLRAIQSPSIKRLRRVTGTLASYSRSFSAMALVSNMIRQVFPALVPSYRSFFGALGTLRPECRHFEKDSVTASKQVLSGQARLREDLQIEILPGLLHYGDAISMAHSIESRLPFLDYRLVEVCVSLSSNQKVADGYTKRIVREMLHRAGQHDIAERADKKGYPTPVSAWLSGNRGEIARRLLLSPGARIQELCDPRAIARLINMQSLGVPRVSGDIYRLVSTEIWLQECLPSA